LFIISIPLSLSPLPFVTVLKCFEVDIYSFTLLLLPSFPVFLTHSHIS
jgi:hypothetical protein